MERNILVPKTASLMSSWLSYARPAGDCQDQNAELLQHPDRRLYVHLLRDVRKGEEIRVWFSSDLLREMDVPFLEPIHIRGPGCYACNRCGTIYNQPNPLKVHLRFFCTSNLPEKIPVVCREVPSSAVPPVLCLTNKSHQRSPSCSPVEETDSNDLATTRSSSVVKDKGHVCSYCGKTYSRRYGLKIHVRTHTGYKPLQCSFCARPFSDPSNLNKHVRLHADADTPYRCRHCGKVLVRRRDLERHVRSRHPDVVEDQPK